MIKVLVAEDMHMLRGALVALLNLEHDIDVVAEVATGTDIVPAALRERPDVAIIDIDLPGLDGITAVKALRDELPECRTLILTNHGQPGTIRRALDAKVNGFMLKDTPADQLANAIRQVAVGRRVIDSDLALSAWESAENPLTDRELEVLRLAANGSSTDEIAQQLFLSPGTVRNYLTTCVNKLHARTRLDAIRIAQQQGLL